MVKVLVVVDMQKDFIDGSLGTKEAVAIVPNVKEKIENFDGKIYFTRDTHFENYLKTQEGKNLPVVHCVKGTDGWQINDELDVSKAAGIIDKPTFGSTELVSVLSELNETEGIESVELIGLCTDICVISNALLIKASMTEIPVLCDAKCCAGVTPESHENALKSMAMCQVEIVR